MPETSIASVWRMRAAERRAGGVRQANDEMLRAMQDDRARRAATETTLLASVDSVDPRG